MTGAEVVVQVLADEGVNTIFGYSGGAILPTFDALFRYNQQHPDEEEIRMIVPANEQGAGFMAAGYARASGAVGVAMVTSGPGATNTVTPVRDSMADSVPMVVICGQVPRAVMGTDAFQEAPIFNIMSACAKHVFLVSDEARLEATLRTAFEIARSGRPGPVVIDLPKDIQNATVTFEGGGRLHFRGYDQRMEALYATQISADQVTAFMDLLRHCKRPLIYAGGGLISGNAAEELRAFAGYFGIPVVTTLLGIGALDTRDELCLHMLGMHGTAYANYAVEDCDLLIAAGTRFDDRVAGKVAAFAPHARFVHLDIDAAEIDKVKHVDWSFAGDCKQTLPQLVAEAKQLDYRPDFAPWRKHVAALRQTHVLNYDRQSASIQPYYVLETINELIDGEAIFVTGVGQHQMWAAQYLHCRQPRSFITSGSMGTMGFGLPAAIGAQLAYPDKLVIDVDGDGSLRMNQGELETMTSCDIPVKVLLLNNHADGMVRQWQRLYYAERFCATDKTLKRKDFVRAAEADGFAFARRISHPDEVRPVLEAFLSFSGPALLEVIIDRDAMVLPMVGPGQSYSEMITGDFIASRDPEAAYFDKSGSMF